MFSRLSFACVLLLLLPLLLLTRSSEGAYIVEVGQNAYLPCSYTPSTPGKLVPVCWGQGVCPMLGCYSMVLSTDETNVNYQKSSRYRLTGDFHKGDMSLTIVDVTLADSGTYCCRIQYPGPMNDDKLNLELVIKPAKVIPAPTAWRDFTTALPRMLTTQGCSSGDKKREIQTQGTSHDKNQTQIPMLINEDPDSGETLRIGVYTGAGIAAGLALVLLFGTLILKWYFHRKNKLQNLSLITLASLPPSGLANAVAEGMCSEGNIYTIEENVYEMQDPDYCYISSGQPS